MGWIILITSGRSLAAYFLDHSYPLLAFSCSILFGISYHFMAFACSILFGSSDHF